MCDDSNNVGVGTGYHVLWWCFVCSIGFRGSNVRIFGNFLGVLPNWVYLIYSLVLVGSLERERKISVM